MQYETRHSESYGRGEAVAKASAQGGRSKILTGSNEKANDLAFDKEPDGALASQNGA